eukprot:gene14360-5405_t
MAVGDVVFPKEEDKYKVDANEVIHMKLVRTAEDVKNESNAFQPEMSHQVFGDTESIFGYNGLHVKLYYHAGSLLTYLGMEYKGKVPDSLGIEADKVLPNIAEILAPGYCTNLDEFVAKLPGESKFTPMGTKIHSYKVKDTEYEIYQVDISVPGFREYHERLQTFILWYIDAASFIAELLQTVYNFYQPKEKVIDITVEDPSEDFIRLRDYVDCQRCISLPAFTPDNLINGFSDSMATEARQKFKISKLQARRVYEILRLNVTNTGDPEQYRNYRLDIKKRLNAPLKKEARYLTKLQSALSEEEFKAAMFNLSGTEKMKRLEEAFKLLEADYRRVLHRLATA